ncbi:hypothetical protein ACHWQZ_G015398 [Mnemiopsis leidyi]
MRCDLQGIKLRLIALLITCYTVGFIGFVAWNGYKSSISQHADVFEDLSPLIQNVMLLLLFVLQHSLLKHLKHELNLSPARHRLLYLFSTTATLHVIYWCWRKCSLLYSLTLTTPTVQVLHVLSWTWLVSSILLADFSELFGFKHISNEERGMEEPIYYKSQGARRLLEHYRHPVAVGPLVLLLSCKVMTTDRLLLAVVFVLYTFSRTYLDYQDYLYLRYVSYPARRYTFQKVEIRSRATVIRETQSSFCFSDEEDSDVIHSGCDVIQTPDATRRFSLGSDTDAGYSSSPTFYKPDYFKIISQTKKGEKVVETTEVSGVTEVTEVREVRSMSSLEKDSATSSISSYTSALSAGTASTVSAATSTRRRSTRIRNKARK